MTVKVFFEDDGLSVGEFTRRMRGEWRRRICSELGNVYTILDCASPKIRRELKLQDDCKNSEKMLETL